MVGGLLVLLVSHVISWNQIEMIELYRAMGSMPAQQLKVLESLDLSPMRYAILGLGAASIVLLLGFLIATRKAFLVAPPAPDEPQSVGVVEEH